MLETGAMVYFQDPKHSWIVGTVEIYDGQHVTCRPMDPKEGRDLVPKLKEAQVFLAREDVVNEDVNDLLNLTVLHDATLLNCLKRRYLKDIIYTNIGAIVVALNPFNFKIPWYMDDKMGEYLAEGDIIEKNLPHSWAVAHNTYFEMRNNSANQSCLFSGESGAGKTEATKIVMKYLAAVSCKAGTDAQKEAGRAVGAKINLTSPALECWGNAKTVRNDNSSRFGKFMKMKFDNEGFLIGVHITKYLLERSRIVTAAENERAYHALYLVTRSKDGTADRLECANDSAFRTLTAGKCVHNKEFDSPEEFLQVCDAMKAVGMNQVDIDSLWAVVSSILHLGNVLFQADGEGSAVTSSTRPSLTKSCEVLHVEEPSFEKELITTTLSVAGQLITKILSPVAAMDAKEALMKSMYDFEFQWLVDKCNDMLNVPDMGNWIGLLDIFGFEDFEVNSFEQICINLANEALQGHYNTYIFEKDLDECRAEGIDMSSVEFPDNSMCIALVAGKTGLIAMLDEECMLGKGSDLGFLHKFTSGCSDNPFYQRTLLMKSSFTIKHYAGDVTYEVSGFLDKNRDTLKDAFKVLMRESTNEFVAHLLPAPLAEGSRKVTVGGVFRNQLRELMEVLNATNPHWVRCIKPHPAKKPLQWSGISVMSQLSSSGVLGTVKIRKAGFPVRIKHADFIARYNVIAKTIDKIFEAVKLPNAVAQKGTIRVFLKTEAYLKLEGAKKTALRSHAQCIQAYASVLKDIDTIKAKQYEANKALYERLRKVIVALREFAQKEEKVRSELQAKFLKTKDDLYKNSNATVKAMEEEWRRMQIERLREEYERKQREEAALAEKRRLEKLRFEQMEKRKEQKRKRENELRDLEAAATQARREREEKELAEALEVKEQLAQHLAQKSHEMYRQRQQKRESDRKKAEEAKQRRTLLEERELKNTRTRAQATEEQLIRGEITKAKNKFEFSQRGEEKKVKMEVRRWAVAARIADDEIRRTRFLETQLAVADARHSFMAARKRQIEKDNNVLMHIAHIEEEEQRKEVEIMHQEALRNDREEIRKTSQALQSVEKIIDRFEGQAAVVKIAAKRMMEPFDPQKQKRSIASRSHHTNLSQVQKSLSSLGDLAHREQTFSTRDAFRTSLNNPVPRHIDPMLYRRLEGKRPQIVEKYGTAEAGAQALYDVPWRN